MAENAQPVAGQSSPEAPVATPDELRRAVRQSLSHLDQLEAESIHIFREVVAGCEKPVLLFSIGKDSTAMLQVARKAFAPGRLPFPLMHVDTTFKFPEMIAYRDRLGEELGVEMIVYENEEAFERKGRDYKCWSCTECADLLKRQALVDALTKYGFDAAFGGARRDEEKSRAKERILSHRDRHQIWEPKAQRPELWNLYNTRHAQGESFRVFPLSNWTELDVWCYIHRENLPIVPLYYGTERPTVIRGGTIISTHGMIDAEEGEEVVNRTIRYRSLGCQICTGAVESTASSLEEIIGELMVTRYSERQNRVVDQDREGSMEEKKREGYF